MGWDGPQTGPADQILSDVVINGRDYLVAYQLIGIQHPVIAAKRVLREGELGGATATADVQDRF